MLCLIFCLKKKIKTTPEDRNRIKTRIWVEGDFNCLEIFLFFLSLIGFFRSEDKKGIPVAVMDFYSKYILHRYVCGRKDQLVFFWKQRLYQ